MKIRTVLWGALWFLALAMPVTASAAGVRELEAAVNAALQADRREQLEPAVAKLKRADPANPVLAQGLVRLVGQGRDVLVYDALFSLNAAIAKHPGDLALKRTRALFVVSAPWDRLALADLEAVIAGEDPGAVALQAFVDAAAGNDRTDLGERKLTDLLGKRSRPDPGLLRARADIRYIRANYDGALEDVGAAAKVSAPTLDDHLLRYRIHTKRGDDPAALADVDAMRAMLPADRGLMRMRAALLIRLGRSAAAEELLLKANR